MNQPPYGLSLDEALALLDWTLTRWTRTPALSAAEELLLEQGAGRLSRHEPLAYVTGFTDFGPLRLLCAPPVLIPRPETEEWLRTFFAGLGQPQKGVAAMSSSPLAASAVGTPRLLGKENGIALKPLPAGAVVVDVGTGSGAIGLWVKHHFPHLLVLATDLSEQALALAAKNAGALNLELPLLRGDLLSVLQNHSVDVLLGNPPYICPTQKQRLSPSLAFESDAALYSDEAGLSHLRRLLGEAPRVLKPGGVYGFETGFDQSGAVRGLPHEGLSLSVGQDEAGRDRFVFGQRLI